MHAAVMNCNILGVLAVNSWVRPFWAKVMEMAMVRSIHDVLYASVFQIIGMTIHRARANTSHMARMHTQWVGGHNPCYRPTKMGTVTGRSCSRELAAVRSLHDILHVILFHIIGVATQDKGKHLSHGLHTYSTGWGP